MRKFLIFFLSIVIHNLYAQYLNLDIIKTNYEYKVTDSLYFMKVKIEIKNDSENTVGFVVENKNVGKYYLPNEYNFGDETIIDSGVEENIFTPRVLMFNHSESTPLEFENIKSSPYYTENYSKKMILIEKEKRNEKIKKLKNYQRKYFPSKSLWFVERAKYVNDNFVILKPKESICIELLFDPQIYNQKSGVGFLLEKNKKYDFIIKIYNDIKTVKKYLNSKNRKIIQKEKIVIQKENLLSDILLLITS